MLTRFQREVEIVERALEILQLVAEEEPIGIRRASTITDHPKHRVRRSFQLLETEGLLRSTDDGAVTADRTTEFLATVTDDIESLEESVRELATIMNDRE